MDANEQRARFEAWANDYDPLSNPQFHYGAGYIGQVRNRYRPISYADADLLWQAWNAALAQQMPADGEWMLVPREPTNAMLQAAAARIREVTTVIDAGPAKGATLIREPHWNVYTAMLAATPQAPQPVVDATIGQQAMDDAMKGVLASLVAAISLLERGGKKAAPSNRMFEQMLADYRKAAEQARAALAAHGKGG